jgi:glycosyltransferase involved in cell wall biosynthesis
VPFVPYDEDFGLVALEAQLAGKPVITCTDSGGVTEMVLDGVSGRVVPPEPAALGRAMNEFSHSPLAAQAMGEAALRTARSVSWAPIVESLLPPPSGSGDTGPASAPIGVLVASGRAAETVRPGGGSHSLAQMLSAQPAQQFPHDLLSELDRITGRASGRRTILVLSTYPAFPAVHGGQLRLNRLLRGLATRFDVELLALSLDRDRGITEPFPGIRQSVIPMSEEHQHLDRTLAAAAPIPIGDIAAALFVQHSSEFLDAVRQAGRGAVGVVLEHPYLLPALVRSHPTLPFVYDSQNAETEMKSQMLDGYRGAEDLVAVVRTVEREAVRRAELVVVCSTEDQRRLELLGGPTLARWAVVPNGADVFGTPFVEGEQRRVNREHWLAAYTTAQPDAQVRHLALFVGSYHPPNLQAATFLANLAPSLPQVCFILAGNLGLYFDGWRLPDNVLVTGQVSTPYLRQLLGAVDVALNPITTGGGTNLKLIEYFAAGAPVISTSLGTRGMRVENEGELLVCETGMFDEAIRSVLAEPKDAAERAARARKLAEQQYDWGPLARRFARTLDRCFSDGAPLH